MTNFCRRFLICALVLSLLIHLVAAAVIRPIHSVEAAPEQQPMRIHIIVIHTPPPPTPTPAPTHPPKTPSHPRAPIHPRPATPTVVSRNGKGPSEPVFHGPPDNGTPGPAINIASAQPGSPVPTGTPKPACSVPNAPAAAVSVVSPSVPDELGTDVNAQAQVRVTLTPSGGVESAGIYHSAGNALLDREALRAARQSTYRAEVRDCVPVRGDYLFTVDFAG
jgi:periplasmic protein TonB